MGGIAVPMSGQKASLTNITAETSADVCFRDLGISQMTNGALRHELHALFLQYMPLNII